MKNLNKKYKEYGKEYFKNICSRHIEGYCREHLVPKSFDVRPHKAEFSFDMSDIRWFNDFESDVEWEKGDDFDSDELQEALYEEISNDISCSFDGFSFTVKL